MTGEHTHYSTDALYCTLSEKIAQEPEKIDFLQKVGIFRKVMYNKGTKDVF
jgi:hypothetical protein